MFFLLSQEVILEPNVFFDSHSSLSAVVSRVSADAEALSVIAQAAFRDMHGRRQSAMVTQIGTS